MTDESLEESSDPTNSQAIAELTSKVQTHEHIEKVCGMIRTLAIELLDRCRTHDQSKFSHEEWETYSRMTAKLRGVTYDSPEYRGFLKEMKPALDHHYANNRHHPEHHGAMGIDGMNIIDVIEMWCDWWASGQRHADGSMITSIQKNKNRFNMDPQLVLIFMNTWADYQGGTLSTLKPQDKKE